MRKLTLKIAGAMLASTMTLTTAASAAEGDAAKGEKLFKRCAACHSLEEGKRKVGPSLYGLFGRTSGTLAGFKYSPAMKNAAIVWSAETLDPYLENPRQNVKGTKMIFPGLKKPQDRADVIAYLKANTGS